MAATVAISSIDYSAYAARLASRQAGASKATGKAVPSSAGRQASAGVVVSLSSAGRERYAAHQAPSAAENTTSSSSSTASGKDLPFATAVRTDSDLTEQERQAVQELRSIDSAVRAHEQAHQSAGGRYAGAPSYTYTSGPDNRQYATAGEVPIDASPEQKPRETVEKMKIIQRAALAPADPSGQDRSVYAHAVQLEQQALMQLNRENAK